MKEVHVESIVEAILKETILDNWYFYLLFFCISLLGAYIGSYLRAFSSEKAKYKAIESSLNVIKRQVSETTKTAEKIKQDIELNVWREKDREMLKRQKLEEYLSLLLTSKDAFHSEMENKYFKVNNTFDEQAYNKADLIQGLYLPELTEEHDKFKRRYGEFKMWLGIGLAEIAKSQEQGNSNAIVSSQHMDKYVQILVNFDPVIKSIFKKAKEVANKINT